MQVGRPANRGLRALRLGGKATMPVSALRDAVESGAFLSFVLSRLLCDQDRQVEQAPAGWLASVHSFVRERLEPLLHSSPQVETGH